MDKLNMRGIALAWVVVVLLTLDLGAAELTISLVAEETHDVPVTLIARRVDSNVAPVSIEGIRVPGVTRIELGEGLWEVRVVASDLWSAPVIIRDGDSGAVRVWPAVDLPVQTNSVNALHAHFTSLEPGGPSGDVDCRVKEGSWTCSIPRGLHDLRFSTPGAAPEYRFGTPVPLSIEKPPVHLTFVSGASLSGTLATVRGVTTSVEGVEVSLTSTSLEEGRRGAVTKANAKGFFQFRGLSPGDYTLRATKEGLTAQMQSVKVIDRVAAELREPLLLDRPKRLTVSVTPPIDATSKPWRVRLLSVHSHSNRLVTVSESVASPAGEWSQSGLPGGEYQIEIRASDGRQWKSERVTIGGDDVTFPMLIVGEQVSGRITLGNRPLVASLSFGGENGPTLRSDEDGLFAGDVTPGENAQWSILIQAETPTVKRTIQMRPRRVESGALELEIDLPATTLMGRVVNEDRSPAADAILRVTRDDPHEVESTYTENDGSFQVAGLEPGTYEVIAESFEHESTPTSVKLGTDAPAEVELIVRREVQLRGRMVVGSAPVIEAAIYTFPRDTRILFFAPVRTDQEGRFLLRLPPGTTTYDLFATHPAFDVVMGRLTIEKGKYPVVRVRQTGGTLVVESPSPQDLLLKHDGAELWLQWGAKQAGGTIESQRVTFPRLEAGQYSVCSATSKKCASGFVPPHGTLTLSVD